MLMYWRRRRRLTVPGEVDPGRAVSLLSLYLAGIFVLHAVAMMLFEGLSPGDAAWLTATTITTVGYGDLSASSAAGRVATVALVYAGGIFLLAKGAGDYFDYRAARRQRMAKGQWRWNLKNHALLINAPQSGAEQYFATLIRQFRETEWGRDRAVLILTEAWPEGLPASLRELGVAHVHGKGETEDGLEAADAARAAAVVVLAGDRTPATDSVTFDIVHRLRGAAGSILAECVDDRNRARLREAGASVVMRPMRGYPEMVVRAMVAPGSEFIIENLFTAHGDECVRYEIEIQATLWGELAAELIRQGVGTPIAYADAPDGAIVCNPLGTEKVSAVALYILIKEGTGASPERVRQIAERAATAPRPS